MRQVLQTLEQFPAHLEYVYLDSWHRILDSDPEHAALGKEAFVWILNSRRSMTIDELCHALAICPETHAFQQERLMSEAALITLCRGLVVVEDTSRTVRLVRELHLARLIEL